MVDKAVALIKEKYTSNRTVVIDLFAVGNEKEFLELFAREVLKAVSDKWEERIHFAKELFKSLIPKIDFGPDPYSEFSLSFDRDELKKHCDEILNLQEVLAYKRC